jgi:hypothetical protein
VIGLLHGWVLEHFESLAVELRIRGSLAIRPAGPSGRGQCDERNLVVLTI